MGRRIIGGYFQSVDGVIQAPGGPEEDPAGGFRFGGWLAPLFDEGLGNQIETLFSEPYDLLLGRRTYEIFAAHWPYQPADDPLAATFNRISKFVLSRSKLTPGWQGTHRLAGMDALAALKAQDGPSLVIQGSATLYAQLLAHDLLDRLVTMTAPVIFGRGKRAFADGDASSSLRMVEQRVTAGGTVMTTWDVAGAVETGSFAMLEPSAAELSRRERWAGEDSAGS
ncbi:MAG TPA: dihydrofolate reductase family protein [Allosphingosinicella sp.]|nr:dihydrofolate reductase family protein [Allosphingosinicella sp.]